MLNWKFSLDNFPAWKLKNNAHELFLGVIVSCYFCYWFTCTVVLQLEKVTIKIFDWIFQKSFRLNQEGLFFPLGVCLHLICWDCARKWFTILTAWAWCSMSTCTSIKKNSNWWVDKRMLASFYLQDTLICMSALSTKIKKMLKPEKRYMVCIPRLCLVME